MDMAVSEDEAVLPYVDRGEYALAFFQACRCRLGFAYVPGQGLGGLGIIS
jgi:hypothetical protein